MNKQQTLKVAAALRDLAAGCSKIASLDKAQKAAAAEQAKTAAAPSQATVELRKTVASKIASLFEVGGTDEAGLAQKIASHDGTLDILNKVLDTVQQQKTASASEVNQPVSGLGQPANPVQVVNGNGSRRADKPITRINRR